jgi:hypothetical protein
MRIDVQRGLGIIRRFIAATLSKPPVPIARLVWIKGLRYFFFKPCGSSSN